MLGICFLELGLVVTSLCLQFLLQASDLLGLCLYFLPGLHYFLLKLKHGHLLKLFVDLAASSLLVGTTVQLELLYFVLEVVMNQLQLPLQNGHLIL